MKENSKLIAKNAVFLYIRMAVVMIVSIYMSRIVLAQLGEIDYGVYNVVGGVVGMIMSINSALAFGTQRFISFYTGKGDSSQLSKVFTSAFVIHLFLALLILIVLETIGIWFINNILSIPSERLYAANIVLQISIITSFIAIIQVPFSALIIAHEQMNIYAYVALVDVALKLSIAISLAHVSFDKLVYFAIMLAGTQVIQALIYIVFCKRRYCECRLVYHREKHLYVNILSYSSWNLLGTAGFMCSDQGVNMMLNVFFGPSINAARAIAFQIKNAINQFIISLQTSFNPQLVKLYAEGERTAMLRLLYNNIKYSLLLIWVILLPLYLELDFILPIWLVKVPPYTLSFARITLIKIFFVCFEQPFITVNGATGNNKVFTSVSALFLLSTLPFSYIGLKILEDPTIVFVIDLLVYFFMIVWKVLYLKKQVGLSVEVVVNVCVKPILYMAMISLPISYVASILIKNQIVEFILVCFISFVLNFLCAWGFVLSQNAKKMILIKVRYGLKK